MFGSLGSGDLQLGLPGAIVRSSPARTSRSRKPSTGAVGATATITAGGASNDSTYVVRLTIADWSTDVSVTTDSTATDAELAALVAAGLLADGLASSVIDSAIASSADVLVTFRPGVSGTFSFPTNPSTHLSVSATTAAAAAPQFLYGRAVAVTGPESVALVSAPASQVVLFDIGHSASQTYVAHVLLTGPSGPVKNVLITWAAGASPSATATAAKAAIDTALAGYMTSAVATNDVRVTMFPGYSIAETTAPTGGTGTLALPQETAAGAYPKLTIVGRDDGTPVFDALGSVGPPVGPLPGCAVTCHDAGAEIAVDAPGAVTFGAPVFVEFAAGDNRGKLYTAASATRGPVPGWSWSGRDSTNPNIAAVAI